ncbi:MAG: hypothetical protein MI861_19910, partial [Pirellulales bacterium]|nr:hypothetical protein [Pirellulales bacterium]
LVLILLALIDWLLFLPDWMRWGLSGFAYLCLLAVVWQTALRLLWREPDESQMARWIELAEPNLREELISAVELGEPDAKKPWHSSAFRRFLQINVAEKMSDVQVPSLLPWALIHRWINVATIVLILFLLLLCIPGLQFGRRVTRMLLPMANIDRVSLTQIEILAPNPADTAVAQGDEIDIEVRVGGAGADDDVTLETWTAQNAPSRLPMTAVAGGHRSYRASVRVGRESVSYRVWANDARSDTHVLSARQRPQVVSFEKTYHYPDYLQQPTRRVSESSGDLAAVEGTNVTLVAEVTQRVSSALIRLETTAGEQVLPMTVADQPSGSAATAVEASVPMTASGTYTIELVAHDSGLENKFRPEYMIRVDPDQPPSIRIDQPPPAILVPADEIVSLQGTADDDWALRRIEQHVRVGEGPWTQTTVLDLTETTTHCPVDATWDLYPLNLDPGSVVFTKLVAVDRKGSVGESQEVRAVISSHEFDPRRWSGLSAARSVHDALVELETAANRLRDATDAANDAASRLKALESLEEYDRQAEVAFTAIDNAIQASSPGRPAVDLVLVGRAVSQASAIGASFVQIHLAEANDDEAKKAGDFVQSRISDAARSYDHLLRLSELTAVADDLRSIGKMNREAIQRARGSEVERVQRRVNVISSEAEALAGLITAMGTHASPTEKKVLQQIETDLQSVGELGTRLSLERLNEANQSIETSLANSISLFQDQLLASVAPRQQLLAAAGHTDEAIFRSAHQAQRWIDRGTQLNVPLVSDDAGLTGPRDARLRRAGVLTQAALNAAISDLAMTATWEQRRPDSQPRFVADTSRARRAVELITARAMTGIDTPRATEDLKRLAAAVGVINIVHNTDDMLAIVQGIHRRESQTPSSRSYADQRMHNPSDWFCGESLARSLVTRLQDVPSLTAAADALRQGRQADWYTRVRVEMIARAQPNRPLNLQLEELEAVLANLKRARQLMNESLDEARRTIAELSPDLEQLLADLAEDLRADSEALAEQLQQAEAA